MILKSNRITYLFSHLNPHFLTNSLCHTHCSHSTGLGTSDLPPFRETSLIKILCDLSCLATTCLTNNDQYVILHASLDQRLFELKDRQGLFLLFYGKTARLEIFSWLYLSWQILVQYFIKVSNFFLILLLSDFSSLFGILNRVHSFSIQGSLRIFDDPNWREINPCFCSLSSQKRRFLVIDLNIDLFNFFIDISF